MNPNRKLARRVYVLLDPPDAPQTGDLARVLGPFRIVQIGTAGIWASTTIQRPRRIARVNDAGRFTLRDKTEWDFARMVAPADGMDLEDFR